MSMSFSFKPNIYAICFTRFCETVQIWPRAFKCSLGKEPKMFFSPLTLKGSFYGKKKRSTWKLPGKHWCHCKCNVMPRSGCPLLLFVTILLLKKIMIKNHSSDSAQYVQNTHRGCSLNVVIDCFHTVLLSQTREGSMWHRVCILVRPIYLSLSKKNH